jgi:hypothetical protein
MRKVLAELMAEKTFEPFVFVMNSGDRYEVRTFEMAVWGEDYITVFYTRSNRRDLLRFSAITSLEILDPNEANLSVSK